MFSTSKLASLVVLAVASSWWSGCTCAETPGAPASRPAQEVKPPVAPAASAPQQPTSPAMLVRAQVEAFCSGWDRASWMLFGQNNPFRARIMSKVRRRGEKPPAVICRRAKVVKTLQNDLD